jgi:hypothetical protein
VYFVLNHVIRGNNIGLDLVQRGFGALLPSLVEGEAVNVLKDVDSRRRVADLEDGVWIVPEIGGS